MTVTREASSYTTAIQQRITSGNHFDGSLPGGALTQTNHGSLYKYAAGTAGGLFFWETHEPLVCVRFHVDLGANANISLSLVNLDDANAVIAGESILLQSLTAVRYLALDESTFKLVLLPNQALQLVTTNSSAAQIATAAAILERSMQR